MTDHTKVLIIGGGPAGLTAALYAGRAELQPIVMEGMVPGGQLMITTEVENFPGFPKGVTGPDLVSLLREQAGKFGTHFRYGMITAVDTTHRPFRCEIDEDPEDVITADTIIISTGADARWLGLDDEKRLLNAGVSACATCDGAFFKGVEIGLVGGGDTAMEEALFLTRYGTRIHVVHRREELRASKIMAHRALQHPKIEFHWNQEVTAIGGDFDSGVTSVTTHNNQTGEDTTYPWKALFIAIGHKPNSAMWKGVLDMDDAGYLITAPGSTRTNVPGIFACGDVQDSVYRQAITAAGTGCMAAIDAERWMEAEAHAAS